MPSDVLQYVFLAFAHASAMLAPAMGLQAKEDTFREFILRLLVPSSHKERLSAPVRDNTAK